MTERDEKTPETAEDAEAEAAPSVEADAAPAEASAEPRPTAEGELAIPATEDGDAAALAEVEAERDELRRQAGEARNRYLRLAADFDNYRKRAAKQEVELRERAKIEALRDFLPVVDNVERALACAVEMSNGETVAEGLRMVVKGFLDAFSGQGLKRFESLGKPFDPLFHEAAGQAETTEKPPGTVVQELQTGYTLRERLLRPALVIVARPPRPPAEESEDSSADSPADSSAEAPEGAKAEAPEGAREEGAEAEATGGSGGEQES